MAVARERGARPAQIALAWLLAQPEVAAPIVGATRIEHLDDLVAATTLRLTDEELKRLEAPYKPHAILGHTAPTARDMVRGR